MERNIRSNFYIYLIYRDKINYTIILKCISLDFNKNIILKYENIYCNFSLFLFFSFSQISLYMYVCVCTSLKTQSKRIVGY